MIKTFISYYHSSHQIQKNQIADNINLLKGVKDKSVDSGDIDTNLPDKHIRKIIRDKYLKDTNVTIVLVGSKTKNRKYIDWEVHLSMYRGNINTRSGILIINMKNNEFLINDDKLKKFFNLTETNKLDSKKIRKKFPFIPTKLMNNLVKKNVCINIIPYTRIKNDKNLLLVSIKAAYEMKDKNKYSLPEPMRVKNKEKAQK